jgi:hypothetical protein
MEDVKETLWDLIFEYLDKKDFVSGEALEYKLYKIIEIAQDLEKEAEKLKFRAANAMRITGKTEIEFLKFVAKSEIKNNVPVLIINKEK